MYQRYYDHLQLVTLFDPPFIFFWDHITHPILRIPNISQEPNWEVTLYHHLHLLPSENNAVTWSRSYLPSVSPQKLFNLTSDVECHVWIIQKIEQSLPNLVTTTPPPDPCIYQQLHTFWDSWMPHALCNVCLCVTEGHELGRGGKFSAPVQSAGIAVQQCEAWAMQTWLCISSTRVCTHSHQPRHSNGKLMSYQMHLSVREALAWRCGEGWVCVCVCAFVCSLQPLRWLVNNIKLLNSGCSCSRLLPDLAC